jgi:polyisoprenoid-binding protein YceI
MKKLLFLPMFALLIVAAQAQNNYPVNTGSSVVVWTGYKVTGKHTGTVRVKSGNVQFTNGVLTGGSFEMDMNSVNCTDQEGEWAAKLVGHLKSDDFLGVASHPTASFVITRAIPQDSKGNYKLIGNMTIKGTTKEVKFFANATESNGTIGATGKMTIDRSEYNMRYGSGSFFDGLGDKTIYDEFDLQVTLVAGK